ncbi:MAG: ComF family protein [Alphaproteobacteria bacterium]|nr:ComF family protein [Alphaproteobacteria bacterium]
MKSLDRAGKAVGAWGSRALDLILPPTCPITGERVERPGLLSAAGWSKIRFIEDPVCAHCGAPFAYDQGEGAECAACIAAPPAFDRARASVVYDDASHRLIVGFKHSDRTELAPLFAGWLKRAGAALFREGTILIPTPLHRRRLIARRFNQAAILAQRLAEETGARLLLDGLVRTRATPPQKSLSADARRRNVAGAFAVREDRKAEILGGRIILIDDVMTTGATLSAAARALKRAGAAEVDALVLARAMKDGVDAF